MESSSILKSKKLRQTDFRLAVLDIFKAHNQAISVDQIEDSLVDFDRVTLYRTLKAFKEKGVIHDITYPDGLKMMALCNHNCGETHHKHEHIHFQCKACDAITCVPVEQIPTINLTGYQLEHVEIQAQGICPKCG